MKPSKYNVFVPDGERVYAVNLLSRAAVDLSRDVYAAILRLCTGNASACEIDVSGELLQFLHRNLFLQNDDFDELQFIRRRTLEERFQSRELGLVIAPTMGCNFSCHYCFEQKNEGVLGAEVEDNLLGFVRSRAGTFDSLAVQWFGGEPLRAMAVIERISRGLLTIALDVGANYAATIITNGYFLTSSVSRALADLGVIAAQITLDGDRPLHDRTRREHGGEGSFDTIINNIRTCSPELAITLRVHLAPFNRKSVIALVQTLADEGIGSKIEGIYFAPLFNYRVGMRDMAYRPDGRRFTTSQQFAEMQAELLEVSCALGLPTKDFLDVSYGICTAVRANTIVVDPKGRITKCYKDVGVEAEAVGALGSDVHEEERLGKWLSIDVPRDEECRKCTVLPLCLGGCSKQWQEGADKSVICSPLRYNLEEAIRCYFRSTAGKSV